LLRKSYPLHPTRKPSGIMSPAEKIAIAAGREVAAGKVLDYLRYNEIAAVQFITPTAEKMCIGLQNTGGFEDKDTLRLTAEAKRVTREMAHQIKVEAIAARREAAKEEAYEDMIQLSQALEGNRIEGDHFEYPFGHVFNESRFPV